MSKIIVYGASYPDVVKVLCSSGLMGGGDQSLKFIDDLKHSVEESFMGFPIAGSSTFLSSLDKNSEVVNNVHSSTRARFSVDGIIRSNGFLPVSVIHSGVDLSYVTLGDGVFIHQGVDIGSNVAIGNGVSIKIAATISHDTVVDEYAFVGPKSLLCGHVLVGRGAYIGAGAIVKERVTIGEGAVVGAGAVVVKDVEPWTVVIGSPAKKLRDVKFFDFGER